jgi:hypothetical protein
MASDGSGANGLKNGAYATGVVNPTNPTGVPPMKVMAIASITKPLSPEQRQQIMPNEVPATLKLYLDGQIEQFWYRQDKPGVIFLMNVESLEQAKAAVNALPLAAGGFAQYELMQVGPLAPLGMLIQGK